MGSFASAIGAALGCVIARCVSCNWMRVRFGRRLAAIDHGTARGGKIAVDDRVATVMPTVYACG
ncbi:MAG: hypothetical protein WBL23_00510 [Salinisphaera sp.]|uniref:hypothetical protein n=1 Tax=Salinisphaera sp. TaxID=1914330 RepID=UPI003C7E2BDB